MIIKEIAHKTPNKSGKARAQAKRETRQALRVVEGVGGAIGNAAVSALGKSTKVGKATQATRPRSVRATIEYALKGDTESQGELIYSQKLDLLEPKMIVLAMDTTAAMNQAVVNPCKHFVISWDEGEKPSRSQMTRSIATYLNYAGYGEHQAVAYLHNDTEKTHIHIVANHVHPVTFKAVHRDFISGKKNHKIREKVARKLEIENGWRRVEGKLHKLDSVGELVERTYEEKILYSQAHSDKVSDKSRRQESYTGKQSFERWCKQSKESDCLRKDIKKLISGKNIDWHEIHKTLRKYDVGIRPDKHGKGLVVYDAHEPDKRCMAASGLSRDLSSGNIAKIINTQYMPPSHSESIPPMTSTHPLAQSAVHPVTSAPVTVDQAQKGGKVRIDEAQFNRTQANIQRTQECADILAAAPPNPIFVLPDPVMTITARPEVIARQYHEAANQIAATDPAKAKALQAAAATLRKQTNARDITLPSISVSLDEINAAMEGMGGRGR